MKKKLCFVVVVIGSGISGSRSEWLLIFESPSVKTKKTSFKSRRAVKKTFVWLKFMSVE